MRLSLSSESKKSSGRSYKLSDDSVSEKTQPVQILAVNRLDPELCADLIKNLNCSGGTRGNTEQVNSLQPDKTSQLSAFARNTGTRKFRITHKFDPEYLRSNFVPPDGGYGWMIALGAFMVQFWVAGLIKCYGVIFMEVLQMFPDASASVASWIPAMLSTLCLFLAPVSSILCQRFTCRAVVFVGGLCCCVGITLSCFATSLLQLFFTFGVLTGIGAGLSTTPGIVTTSRYFHKRRALANAICLSGTAAGSMVLPSFLELLLPEFGFRGSILILGACMLHVCLAAVMYRPIEVHQKIVEIDRFREQLKSSKTAKTGTLDNLKELPTADIEQGETCESGVMVHTVEDISTDSTSMYKDTKLRRSTRRPSPHVEKTAPEQAKSSSLHRYIDLSLVTKPLFVLMTSTVLLTAFGCPHMLIYLPAHMNALGFSKTDAGLLISASAALDLVGRIFFGIMADFHFFSKKKGYIFSILLAGLSVLSLPFVTSFAALLVAVCAYGFGFGGWFLLIPVLLSEYHGTEKIASSYGLLRLFQGTITLSIPPLSGFLRDLTGSYNCAFYVMGTAMICGSLLMTALEPVAQRYTRDGSNTQEANQVETAASA